MPRAGTNQAPETEEPLELEDEVLDLSGDDARLEDADDGSVDGVGAYLREIGRYQLLTAAEEVALSKRIERGVKAARRLACGKDLSARTRADLMAAVDDAAEARERMIRSNLRLVVAIARRYRSTGMPFLDLIQEGNLGLIRAVEKFEWRRGFKFSTYATWWIKQAVQRGVADRGRVIRLPVHIHDMLLRVRKARGELEGRLGREATDDEIAAGSRVSADRVQDLQTLSAPPLSLDLPTGTDGTSTLSAILHDPNAEDGFADLFRDIQRDDLLRVLGTLSEREKLILMMRFGLTGDVPMTLEEVGKRFGLTRERIRQIEGKALAKLRHPSRASGLLESG
jgi:RNA polymerase sigma factor (sigma-70 family)